MPKVVLCGFSAETVRILRRSCEVVWIAPDGDADIDYLSIRDRWAFAPGAAAPAHEVFEAVGASAKEIYECYYRHHYMRSLRGPTLPDFEMLLNAHVLWAAELLGRFRPDAVVFSNIPHEGYDNVLQEVARAAGVRSARCFQVPFAPRHWLLEAAEPIGSIHPRARPGTEVVAGPQDEEHVERYVLRCEGRQAHDYMLDPRPGMPGWSHILRALAQGRTSGLDAMIARLRQRRYQARLERVSANFRARLGNGRYVYFPLHLQPELTTSVLGGLYNDQLLAVRLLSDWCRQERRVLVVKENPKQGFSHRSSRFFAALASLDGVVMAPKEEDTYALIGGAEAVATISGTVGIEALLAGKPVICLGDAWWRCFRGVHALSDAPQSVFGSGVAREQVVEDLLGACRAGRVGCSDEDALLAYGVSQAANSASMAASIERILQNGRPARKPDA